MAGFRGEAIGVEAPVEEADEGLGELLAMVGVRDEVVPMPGVRDGAKKCLSKGHMVRTKYQAVHVEIFYYSL